MQITLHELNNICHRKLGKENYQRYFQDMLSLASFFCKLAISPIMLVSERSRLVSLNLKQFLVQLNKIVNGLPIARIVGYVNWCGLKILVHKHVFIPRIETEKMVETARILINSFSLTTAKCLDLCCGSGCISVALQKHFPNLSFWLIDRSYVALKNAKENAKLHNFNFHFIHSNFFHSAIRKKLIFDIICCNPPYVKKKDKFVKHDPFRALCAKNNGLYFYELFFHQIQCLQSLPKIILLEIGETQGDDVLALLNKNNLPYAHNVILDYYDLPRIISLLRV